jgi:hypothetical protein
MKKRPEKSGDELDIAGLLSLRAFERPDAARAEKNIQNTMHAVRSADRLPWLLLFPDKNVAGIFSQPRYGVAALFVIFLGLHLLDQPMPSGTVLSVPEPTLPPPVLRVPELPEESLTNRLRAAELLDAAPSSYAPPVLPREPFAP